MYPSNQDIFACIINAFKVDGLNEHLLFTMNGRQKKTNRTMYNLTKRTQHTQISAMTAYKIASVAIVTTLSDATSLIKL